MSDTETTTTPARVPFFTEERLAGLIENIQYARRREAMLMIDLRDARAQIARAYEQGEAHWRKEVERLASLLADAALAIQQIPDESSGANDYADGYERGFSDGRGMALDAVNALRTGSKPAHVPFVEVAPCGCQSAPDFRYCAAHAPPSDLANKIRSASRSDEQDIESALLVAQAFRQAPGGASILRVVQDLRDCRARCATLEALNARAAHALIDVQYGASPTPPSADIDRAYGAWVDRDTWRCYCCGALIGRLVGNCTGSEAQRHYPPILKPPEAMREPSQSVSAPPAPPSDLANKIRSASRSAARGEVGPVPLAVRELQRINHARGVRWLAGTKPWSLLEIAGEMCGEAGEAANVAKKILRLDNAVRGNEASENGGGERTDLIEKLGRELADVLIVAVRVASNAGIDLERVVVEKFNATSEKMGFPERLPVDTVGLTEFCADLTANPPGKAPPSAQLVSDEEITDTLAILSGEYSWRRALLDLRDARDELQAIHDECDHQGVPRSGESEEGTQVYNAHDRVERLYGVWLARRTDRIVGAAIRLWNRRVVAQ